MEGRPDPDGQRAARFEGILAEGGKEHPDEHMPAGTRIGHVHLQVGDIKEAEKFYSGILGFTKTAALPGALFVAAGGYHHHIATNVWDSRNAPPPPANMAGLAGLVIELPAAELAATKKRIEDAGVNVESGSQDFTFLDPLADENSHSSHARPRLIGLKAISRTHIPKRQENTKKKNHARLVPPPRRFFIRQSPRPPDARLAVLGGQYRARPFHRGPCAAGDAVLGCAGAGAFAILFGFALPYARRDWRTIKANWGIITLITLLGIGIYNTISYYALQYSQAINALLIVSTGPLLVAAVTFILYREKPTLREVVGVLVSLTGAVIVIAHGDIDVLHHLKINIGDVLFFIAQLVYAFYTALLSKRPKIHPFSFALVTFGWGAGDGDAASLRRNGGGALCGVGHRGLRHARLYRRVPSLLAYLFYNRGVELIGPNRAAPFYHLIPLFGSALAILFLGERPGAISRGRLRANPGRSRGRDPQQTV